MHSISQSLLSDLIAAKSEAVNCTRCHPYLDMSAKEVFGDSDYLTKFSAWHQDLCSTSINKIEANQSASHAGEEIPLCTHHIWVTSEGDPKEPPELFLQRAISSKDVFNEDYLHYFWISQSLISSHPDLVSRLISKGFLVYSAESALSALDCHNVSLAYHAFTSSRKYVVAADILKGVVLHLHGGLYMDMGVVLSEDVIDCARHIGASYVLLYWMNMFFQNTLMASKRGSELTAEYLNIFSSRDSSVHSIDILTGEKEVYLCSGPMVTRILLKKVLAPTLPLHTNCLVLPANRNVVSWMPQKSWYSEDNLLGNCFVPSSKPSFFF